MQNIGPNDKIAALVDTNGKFNGEYLWWCSGCDHYHGVWTDVPNPRTKATWTFSGTREHPTFSPSLVVQWTESREGGDVQHRCHTIIQRGNIQYLADCTHMLAGQTVPMTNILDVVE